MDVSSKTEVDDSNTKVDNSKTEVDVSSKTEVDVSNTKVDNSKTEVDVSSKTEEKGSKTEAKTTGAISRTEVTDQERIQRSMSEYLPGLVPRLRQTAKCSGSTL